MLIRFERHVRDPDTIYEGAIRGAEVAQPHSAVREYNFAVRTGDRGIIDGEVVTFAAAKFVDTLPEQKRSRLGRARVDNQSRHNIWLDEWSMHSGRTFASLLC